MALREIQEYIAQDANNIARVDYHYFLVSPEKEPSNIIIIIHAKRNRDRLPAAILSVYKQHVPSARMHRVINVGHYSGTAIIILLMWNTRFYFGHQKPNMNNNYSYYEIDVKICTFI